MQPFFCSLIPKPKIDPTKFRSPKCSKYQEHGGFLETVPLLFGHKRFSPYIYTLLPKALVQIIILLEAWEYKIDSKIYAFLLGGST